MYIRKEFVSDCTDYVRSIVSDVLFIGASCLALGQLIKVPQASEEQKVYYVCVAPYVNAHDKWPWVSE